MKPDRAKFLRDLKKGQTAELEVVLWLWRHLDDAWLQPYIQLDIGETASHDFFIGLFGEVKLDVREEETGNIAFEVGDYRTGKPSGVLSTTAPLIIYRLHDCLIVFDTKCLQDELRDRQGIGWEVDGGNGMLSKLVLIPRGHVVENFDSVVRIHLLK